MQSGGHPQEDAGEEVREQHREQKARDAQMESGDEDHVEDEQRQRGDDAVNGVQSHQPPCHHELRGDLPEARRDAVDHQQDDIALRVGQERQERGEQNEQPDAGELYHAGGGENPPVVEIPVDAIADDGVCDAEGDDRIEEICSQFQQFLGAVVPRIQVSGVEPGEQQQQNLGAERADRKNQRVRCEFFVFVHESHLFESAMVPVQFADVPEESTPTAQANTYYYSINFGEMEQFF